MIVTVASFFFIVAGDVVQMVFNLDDNLKTESLMHVVFRFLI